MASAASTSRPVVWPPACTTAKSSPSWRTSFIRAKGLIVPVWPPAPPATAMTPSTPASSALSGWRRGGEAWPAGAAGPRDDAAAARLQRLLGMAAVGDVVQGDSPPAMDALDGVAGRTLRGEHDRHLVFLDQFEIAGIARVGGMHAQVHGPRCRLFAGIPQPLHAVLHLGQPGLELLAAAGAVGREAPHDALAAAGQGQRRVGD